MRTLRRFAVGLMAFGLVGLLVPVALAETRDTDASGAIKALNGSPSYVGTIAATTSKTNASTAVPFTLVAKALYLVQCDAAAHLAVASSVTDATGVKLAADEKFYLMLKVGQSTVAVIDTANCAFFKVE